MSYVDSIFRLLITPSVFLCLRFSFVLVCVLLWLGDLTTHIFPPSRYCTQIASKGIPLLPPCSAFRRITHASSTTFLVLSVPLFRCCLSLRIRDLFGLPRFPVLQFDQGLHASLLGPSLRPLCLRYTPACTVFLYSFSFRPMVLRQPSRSDLSYRP